MILVDASVWIDQLRAGDRRLVDVLSGQAAVVHPFVIGEVMLGYLPDRAAVLAELEDLESAPVADDAEVLGLIESAKLFGTGIGYVDAHLIASAMLMAGGQLWTRDRRLRAVAERLGVGFDGGGAVPV